MYHLFVGALLALHYAASEAIEVSEQFAPVAPVHTGRYAQNVPHLVGLPFRGQASVVLGAVDDDDLLVQLVALFPLDKHLSARFRTERTDTIVVCIADRATFHGPILSCLRLRGASRFQREPVYSHGIRTVHRSRCESPWYGSYSEIIWFGYTQSKLRVPLFLASHHTLLVVRHNDRCTAPATSVNGIIAVVRQVAEQPPTNAYFTPPPIHCFLLSDGGTLPIT